MSYCPVQILPAPLDFPSLDHTLLSSGVVEKARKRKKLLKSSVAMLLSPQIRAFNFFFDSS